MFRSTVSRSLFRLRAGLQWTCVGQLPRCARGLSSAVTGRSGDEYVITDEHRQQFAEKGYVILQDFLTEEELLPIEDVYDKFMRFEIRPEGKDLCDMSGPLDRKPEDFELINAMLPRKYHPALQGNTYERRSASVARQLMADTSMELDYDQLLNKKPNMTRAQFAWHQDMAYWPPAKITGPDTRTATFSLALDATTKQNGCLRFVPGSGKAGELWPHVPLGSSREEAHGIGVKVEERSEEHPEGQEVVYCEVPRGAVTVHDEWVVHGSSGNMSAGHRRTYVIAYRTEETVKKERSMGFSHSHNDAFNWDEFHDWGKQ